MKEFIDFNDNKVPIGKRKQAYIKWAISKGTDLISAKRQANKKFGFEMKEGLLAIVIDTGGRCSQRSFTGDEEIFQGYDLRKYKNHKWIHEDYIPMEHYDENIEKIKKEYESIGWEVVFINVFA